MTASIVPLLRRAHVQVAMTICILLVVTAALASWRATTQLQARAPAREAAEGPSARIGGLLVRDGSEPRFSGEQHTLLWQDEFDAPPQRSGSERYGRYITRDARALRHASNAGIDGSGALQMQWAAADTGGASCADDSRLVEASFPPTRELVVSYWARYSSGFVFDWSGRARCHGNAKKLFLLWAQDGSRFVFISENGALGVGSDFDHPLFAQNRSVAVTPAALADGSWHRITLLVRQGSAPQRADGAVYGWIDGVLRWRYDGIVTHNSGGYVLFKMPATFNAGSPVAQTEWLDRLSIWRVK